MAICDASLFSIATSLVELERIDGGAEEESILGRVRLDKLFQIPHRNSKGLSKYFDRAFFLRADYREQQVRCVRSVYLL